MTEDLKIPCLTLTVNQAATALGVGRQSVLNLIRSHALRHVRIGRKIIIPRDAIGEFLERASAV